MLRRDSRLRKEYLYRKSLQEKEALKYENKMALKNHLEQGTSLSSRVKKESNEIVKSLIYDDGLEGKL